MSGCCNDPACRRHYPISLYLGDFSETVYAVTKRRVVSEREEEATFAATERHDVTGQMRRFLDANREWVLSVLESRLD